MECWPPMLSLPNILQTINLLRAANVSLITRFINAVEVKFFGVKTRLLVYTTEIQDIAFG